MKPPQALSFAHQFAKPCFTIIVILPFSNNHRISKFSPLFFKDFIAMS